MNGMSRTIRIGTRGSELALKQAQLAIAALKAQTQDLEIEVVIIRTDGDARTDIPLCEVNKAAATQDKGVFVAAIEQALADGRIDCAVHSLKDMPGKMDKRFEIAAVLPREDIRDALILKNGADMNNLVLGTSSVRRIQMANTFWCGSARTLNIRGNVHTRLSKLVNSAEMNGIILARAGLNRLGFTGDSLTIDGTQLSIVNLDKDSFMPALCQGAVALEIRRDDAELRAIVALANDEETSSCVRAERAFLAELNADCSVPVAGYASISGSLMTFRAIYYPPDGSPRHVTAQGNPDTPEQVGRDACAHLIASLK